MDAKDYSIVAQVCLKAAAELFSGSGDSSRALGAAEEFYAWAVEKSGGLAPPAPPATGGGATPKPAAPSPAPNDTFPPACPDCGGPMWDNRAGKRNPKAPDAKCKDKSCGKGVWLTPYQP